MLAALAEAADKLKFAIVPKAMNNPFFDIARDGCIRRARELDVDAGSARGHIGASN
jgi:ribose transport system substrate-binding protein